jgi:hypothetical protein
MEDPVFDGPGASMPPHAVIAANHARISGVLEPNDFTITTYT